MDKRELINTIAPALRALAAEEDALKLVRFEDDVARDGSAVTFQPPSDGDTVQVVEALRQAIEAAGTKPAAVAVADVGTFRISEPAGVAGAGRAGGKVAVVTGAARGFGLEIAQDLAEQGGYVALCDVNTKGVADAAGELNERLGEDRAVGLSMDVTGSVSVKDALDQVVVTYGGLDLLVSNAGVLRAGSVKTQPVEEFDLVTTVNYRGYFLCVQNAAPIMAVQHLAKSDYWSDIIQINSKSGLAGSSRNSAYAGAKFGGIGLTQSFALELIEDGIKVNAVCPGNYFDGPLWSDPENGLFVQYLRTEKVPGANTVQDVKRAYEAKIPMGRGCTTADVMKAIYYLMEQRYETGQAVAVTGGQIMLS